MTDILLLSLITNVILFAKLANRDRMLCKAVYWLVRISGRNVELRKLAQNPQNGQI